jgi:hypothetical protein
MKNRRIDKRIPDWYLGTKYYKYSDSYKYMSDISRTIPSSKAIGPDGIADRWLRKRSNALPVMRLLDSMINGKANFPRWMKEARLMLLPKDEIIRHPKRTRPICMQSVIKKIFEAAFRILFDK